MSNHSTIEQLLLDARAQLSAISDSARLDAELLLMHILDCSRSYLFTWNDQRLTPVQVQAFESLLHRRIKGEPIAHITGVREFWGLPLRVTADTLIPRPDTEVLVEQALDKLSNNAHILDLGTGTGAIALALKSECPNCHVTAIDFSPAALKIAQENAEQLGFNISFIESAWFNQVNSSEQKFDLIVSNPPYICDQDPHLKEGDVRFEPITALTSGIDGLEDIREICQEAPRFIANNGWLMIEHGYHQREDVQTIFHNNGWKNVITVKDYGDNDRVTLGQWVSES